MQVRMKFRAALFEVLETFLLQRKESSRNPNIVIIKKYVEDSGNISLPLSHRDESLTIVLICFNMQKAGKQWDVKSIFITMQRKCS